jgi:hypothetical protein
MIDGLIIGRWANGEHILVMTHWKDEDNSYVTTIKHPTMNNGKSVVVDRYGKDHVKASREHIFWSQLIQNKSTVQHRMPEKTILDELKISFHTLMGIMYKYLGDYVIVVTPSREYPSEIRLEIQEGAYKGCCVYSFDKLLAWSISPKWLAILNEAKAEIVDKKDVSSDNASECVC